MEKATNINALKFLKHDETGAAVADIKPPLKLG